MLNIGRDGPSILACVLALPFRGVSSILQRLVVLHRTSGADLFAVETTCNPAALIGALETIRAHPTDVVRVVVADSDLWFTFPRPVHGTGGTQSARPTLAERIRAIEAAYGISAASQSGA
jgi:Zn-dependent protease with chaperone function